MTTPGQAPLFDPGNPLLAQVPARIDTGTMDAPSGKLGVVTVRTSSATMTLFLAAADLRDWSRLFGQLADQVSSGIAPASVLDLAGLRDLKLPGS